MNRIARLLPVLSWLPSYRKSDLRSDVAAGLTTGVMIIPQAMAYAMLAGLPPVVGLYAALSPIVAYAMLGTSRQLSVGPVATDSLLVATAVAAIATSGSEQYVAVAGTLGVMVGLIQFGLGLLRMGYVVNFLSRPVISGFSSAAALIVAASQLKYVLRVDLPNTHHVHIVLWHAMRQLTSLHPLTFSIGVGAFLALLAMKRLLPKAPRALVVAVIATAIIGFLNLDHAGVDVVGTVPSGLPGFRMPLLDAMLWQRLLPSAITIALVSFTEAISVGKHFARANRYEVNASQELVALGIANLSGGLLGGYPVAGGFSRTAVHASAGARTQLAALVTVLTVMITLLFLTSMFYSMPKAVLAAIILAAVIGLIDIEEPKRLWRIKRVDFGLLIFTFVTTLSIGIQWGIVFGVVASLLLFVVRTTRPHIAVLGQVPGTEAYLNVRRHPHAVQVPGVLAVRVDAQFYFGNVSFLKETLLDLEQSMDCPLRAIVLDASGMNQLDSSAEAALRELDRDYSDRNVKLYFARVKGPVRDVLYRSGLLTRLRDEGRIFFRTHDAVQKAAGILHQGPLSERPDDPRLPADRIGCGRVSD